MSLSPSTIEPAPNSEYTAEDIERALTVRVAAGSHRGASQLLATELGMSVPEGTLARWVRETYRDRYLELRAELAPMLREVAAAANEDIAAKIAEVEQPLIERVESQIGEMKGKDAAIALKNLALAKNIATDKALLLRGEPTQITEHRDPLELYRRLEQLGCKVEDTGTFEGTAREVDQPALSG